MSFQTNSTAVRITMATIRDTTTTTTTGEANTKSLSNLCYIVLFRYHDAFASMIFIRYLFFSFNCSQISICKHRQSIRWTASERFSSSVWIRSTVPWSRRLSRWSSAIPSTVSRRTWSPSLSLSRAISRRILSGR